MRVAVLASGSRGNATYVESADTRLLLDAGCGPRTIRRRLRSLLGSVPDRLDAVIVTHAHGDHAGYAEAAAASFGAPLYVTSPTRRQLGLAEGRARPYGPNAPLQLGALSVRALALPHDCPQVALIVEDCRDRVALVTDLGRIPATIVPELQECTALLLESNHDPAMLAGGPYPPFLKERVASEVGHLSNGQAAELLCCLGTALRCVVLMHLSQTNNRPELALAAAKAALRSPGTRVAAAHQSTPLAIDTSPPSQLGLGFA